MVFAAQIGQGGSSAAGPDDRDFLFGKRIRHDTPETVQPDFDGIPSHFAEALVAMMTVSAVSNDSSMVTLRGAPRNQPPWQCRSGQKSVPKREAWVFHHLDHHAVGVARKILHRW
jgi:hypothetical protein